MSHTFKALLLSALIVFPFAASAHQPRIVESNSITVTDPEISKAYYATLQGSPQVYHIHSSTPFHFYVNILVPDILNQKTDVTAEVINLSKPQQPIALLGGTHDTWKKFFEPFGYDSYLMGSEYEADVAAGEYDVSVSSPQNNTTYSLAIGTIEMFDVKEGLNAISLIPQIKRDFFHESPAGFIFSMFGYGEIIVLFIFAFLFGFAYRFILKRFASKTTHGRARNIGAPDRWLRAVFGLAIFILAITTIWSPFLLFIAGFCLFEAIFSWCGFYAAIGKNSCPV